MNDEIDPGQSIADTSFVVAPDNPTPVTLIRTSEHEAWRESLDADQQAWLDRQKFTAKQGQTAWLEQPDGAGVVVGWDGSDGLDTLGGLPLTLPTANMVSSR